MSLPPRTIEVPEIYIDSAEVRVNPYTFRLLVGGATDGPFVPAVVLTFSPEFARRLHAMLAEGLAPSQPGPDRP